MKLHGTLTTSFEKKIGICWFSRQFRQHFIWIAIVYILICSGIRKCKRKVRYTLTFVTPACLYTSVNFTLYIHHASASDIASSKAVRNTDFAETYRPSEKFRIVSVEIFPGKSLIGRLGLKYVSFNFGCIFSSSSFVSLHFGHIHGCPNLAWYGFVLSRRVTEISEKFGLERFETRMWPRYISLRFDCDFANKMYRSVSVIFSATEIS